MVGFMDIRGYVFATVSFLILFGLLIAFPVMEYKDMEISILNIFFHVWIICMTWNTVDLIIVD